MYIPHSICRKYAARGSVSTSTLKIKCYVLSTISNLIDSINCLKKALYFKINHYSIFRAAIFNRKHVVPAQKREGATQSHGAAKF